MLGIFVPKGDLGDPSNDGNTVDSQAGEDRASKTSSISTLERPDAELDDALIPKVVNQVSGICSLKDALLILMSVITGFSRIHYQGRFR